jgi:hypothetical protein
MVPWYTSTFRAVSTAAYWQDEILPGDEFFAVGKARSTSLLFADCLSAIEQKVQTLVFQELSPLQGKIDVNGGKVP